MFRDAYIVVGGARRVCVFGGAEGGETFECLPRLSQFLLSQENGSALVAWDSLRGEHAKHS